MKLPNVYNYGTLFAFSGLDGENEHKNDFCGVTMQTPVTIRFDATTPVSLHCAVKNAQMDTVLSDMIESEELLLLFADKHTVLGRCSAPVSLFAEGIKVKPLDGAKVLCADGFAYALFTEGERFAFCREASAERAIAAAKEKITQDLDALRQSKLAYYAQKPPCPRKDYERLYYKCLSVNKVNVYSPQDDIDCRFTTPDRLPHRHMWLWDSMFHAMAFVRYDPQMAKESILAVLQCQKEDGFIPHMMKSRTVTSSITQPQVIAWAVLEVYRRTGDKAFLADCAEKIAAFLLWFPLHRDQNRNGLLEWKTDFSNVRCRCDESGMDNSPRFDTTETLEAIDSSSFFVHDCRCMAEIFRILKNDAQARRFDALANETAQKVNDLLWDETAGGYCDRTLSGKLTGVLTCCSFLPLFAGICDEEKAAKLVELLQDETKFAVPLPVPSISRDHPDFGTDMWRGGVWLNFNYFIVQGLQRYGYFDLARTLREKTLQTVERYFEQTGVIFEFYDALDRAIPWFLERKGPQPAVPDYHVRYHSIADFNWSACFTLLMLLEEPDAEESDA